MFFFGVLTMKPLLLGASFDLVCAKNVPPLPLSGSWASFFGIWFASINQRFLLSMARYYGDLRELYQQLLDDWRGSFLRRKIQTRVKKGPSAPL